MSEEKDFYFKIIHHVKNVLRISAVTEASGEIVLINCDQGQWLINDECKNS